MWGRLGKRNMWAKHKEVHQAAAMTAVAISTKKGPVQTF